MKRFYVYIYLDPRKRGHYCYENMCFLYEPIYIGKGEGRRYLAHVGNLHRHVNLFFKNKLLKILGEFSPQDVQTYILIFKGDLDEQEAFDLEKKLIAEVGRADLRKGPLTNLTDGGDGTSAREFSEITKQKISETLTQNHPHLSGPANKNYGQKRSEETRRKISLSKQGENHPNFGKKRPEEVGRRISEAKKGKAAFSGADHPNYGKPRDEETRKKISESLSGRKCPHSEETKRKIKESWILRKQRAAEAGKPLVSEEVRKKISENQNRSEESKKRRSESHTGKKLSEITRKKMSESRKGRKLPKRAEIAGESNQVAHEHSQN